MGKLRGAETDIGQFGQWLGRKCRNHNPLEELGLSKNERIKKADRYRTPGARQEAVCTVKGREDRVVYRAGGRNFVMTLTEVSDTELEGQELVPVGY